MNEKKIIVIDDNGEEQEAEVINVFKLKSNNQNYMIYTLNEIDEEGLVKLYYSRMVEKNGLYSFESIDNDDEWNEVKEASIEIALSVSETESDEVQLLDAKKKDSNKSTSEEEKRYIEVIDKNGDVKQAEVINVFKLKSNNQTYILYCFDEDDEDGYTNINAKRMVEKNGMYDFETITEDDEWEEVMDAMKEMSLMEEEQKVEDNK